MAGFTAVIMLFELANDDYFPTAVHVSTGITFVIFIGIIIYHARWWLMKITRKVKEFSRARRENKPSAEESVPPYNNIELSCDTSIELTEPLLEVLLTVAIS